MSFPKSWQPDSHRGLFSLLLHLKEGELFVSKNLDFHVCLFEKSWKDPLVKEHLPSHPCFL